MGKPDSRVLPGFRNDPITTPGNEPYFAPGPLFDPLYKHAECPYLWCCQAAHFLRMSREIADSSKSLRLLGSLFPMFSRPSPCDFLCFPIHVPVISYGFPSMLLWFPKFSYPCPCVFPMVSNLFLCDFLRFPIHFWWFPMLSYPCPCDFLWFLFFPYDFLGFPIHVLVIS